MEGDRLHAVFFTLAEYVTTALTEVVHLPTIACILANRIRGNPRLLYGCLLRPGERSNRGGVECGCCFFQLVLPVSMMSQ
jgi:hypothetical protein